MGHTLIGMEEILQDCSMKKGLLQITLAMVRLEGREEIEEARKLMRNFKPELSNILANKSKATIIIENPKNFGQRVVYLLLQFMMKHFGSLETL